LLRLSWLRLLPRLLLLLLLLLLRPHLLLLLLLQELVPLLACRS